MKVNEIHEIINQVNYDIIPTILVFFDVETSGNGKDDVLQICMKSRGSIFNKYLEPRGYISQRATEVNGLSLCGGKLCYHGNKVVTLPKDQVMRALLQFLQDLMMTTSKTCVLVAHNAGFDAPRLARLADEMSLVEEFRTVISGITDTLSLFRRKFPNSNKGDLKLETLAKKMSLSTEGAHDALIDVKLLEAVALHHFDLQILYESRRSFDIAGKLALKSLDPLCGVISNSLRNRLANCGVVFEKIIDIFLQEGELATRELLKQIKNSKPEAIKREGDLDDVINFLKDITHNLKNPEPVP